MIEFFYHGVKQEKTYETLLTSVVEAVLQQEGVCRKVDVSITFTTNEEIHRINREFRQVDRPTDVLSFPMYEREEIEMLRKPQELEIPETLGDIVLSVEKVEEQANEYGHSFERELAYLTVHGMLHLLGYDHMVEEEKMVMRAQEEAVLEKLEILR